MNSSDLKERQKLFRVTTIPMSLNLLLRYQLKFMNEYYYVIAISSPGKDLEEVRTREGVSVVELSMTRFITPVKDFLAVWRMIRILRKERPAIVHTHTPKAGLIGMLAARIAGVPIRVHTVAGMPLMEATGIKRRVLNVVERFTYSCAHRVYPNSNKMKEIILDHRFCHKSKIKVIGNGSTNGVDTSYFFRDNI